METKQKDNSTIILKAKMRSKALALLSRTSEPVILESHGGFGKIYGRCYSHVEKGVVFEKNTVKAAALAQQRPTWSVYECDSERAIAAGVGSHLPVNYFDLDPYGESWPFVEAILSWPKLPSTIVFVVNDGLRQALQRGVAWRCESMAEMVKKIGNAGMSARYLEVCQELLAAKCRKTGFAMTQWNGYYTGANNLMTHYCAFFEKV